MSDGELLDWSEARERHEWDALLLGNGLSRNVWEGFGYPSLYEQACRSPDRRDVALFERLGVTDFEAVLRDLATMARMNAALGQDTSIAGARYESVRATLALPEQGGASPRPACTLL